MRGRLALVGGDEFRRGCEEMDRAIIDATGKACPVVFIVPTAAAFENPARAAENGVRHFAALGADASPLMALDGAQANDAHLAAEVAHADILYLTGGNPAHLLETLRQSALLDGMIAKLDAGGILAGSSAGAMVMGSWMRFRQWRRALGIADGTAILPHHERADPDAVLSDLSASAPADLDAALGIDGRSGVLSGADGWTALGAGRIAIYENQSWKRIESGETFTLG